MAMAAFSSKVIEYKHSPKFPSIRFSSYSNLNVKVYEEKSKITITFLAIPFTHSQNKLPPPDTAQNPNFCYYMHQ